MFSKQRSVVKNFLELFVISVSYVIDRKNVFFYKKLHCYKKMYFINLSFIEKGHFENDADSIFERSNKLKQVATTMQFKTVEATMQARFTQTPSSFVRPV